MKTRLLVALTISFLSLAMASGQNQKMDPSTQDALINKLELVLPQIDSQSEQALTLRARLADLYAERARLNDLKAGEGSCSGCENQAQKDRQTAIRFYESVKNKGSVEILKTAHLQLAHLYRLVGNQKASENEYKNVLKNKSLATLHSQAHVGLADWAFQTGNIKKAQKEYSLAQAQATSQEKAYILYRLAWTQLNLGNSTLALNNIQNAINLAQKNNMSAFHKDLMRDYATLLARQSFTKNDIDQFVRFSPQQDLDENLKFLGEEAERLGNKKGALLIWTQYRQQEQKDEKLTAETQFKIAQNFYDLDDLNKTNENLKIVVQHLNDQNCENCALIIKDFRSLIVSWSKKEKTEPSLQLSRAFDLYLSAAAEDFEATVWAAQVARARNDSARAYALYDRAALLSQKQKNTESLENTLQASLDMAEQSKDDTLREKSMRQYLNLNPKGQLAGDVRYQMALIPHKKKNFAQAAIALKAYALDENNKNTKLREQAADLSLGSYEQLKNDQEIRATANIYAKEFPQKRDHYNEVARKVTINRIVSLLRQSPIATAEIKSELKILKASATQKLNQQDLITHNRTLILAAEKINDLDTLNVASLNLLKIKSLPNDARQLAQKSLLWIYELRLDFPRAYDLAQKMQMPHLRQDQRALRLGLLAELAGKNPETHFRQYLAKTDSVRNANEIRLKLIRRSKNPWNTFEQYFTQLRRTPDLLAEITLDLHLNKSNQKQVRRALTVKGVSHTVEGRYLLSLKEREQLKNDIQNIQKHKFISSSDKSLKRTLRERMRLLDNLKKQYVRYAQQGDLTLQAISLTGLQKQNLRFAQQIEGLPTPKGLTKQERAQYRQLLKQQALPYMAAAQDAKSHLNTLFKINDKALDNLKNALTAESLTARKAAQNELQALKPYLSTSLIREFENVRKSAQTPAKDIARARRNVEENPFDPATLGDLRELEARRANGPLIAYLDERLSQLKSATRR